LPLPQRFRWTIVASRNVGVNVAMWYSARKTNVEHRSDDHLVSFINYLPSLHSAYDRESQATICPLAMKVIAGMIGIPLSDWPRYKRWSDGILTLSYTRSGGERAEAGLRDFFFQLLVVAGQETTSDLINNARGWSRELRCRIYCGGSRISNWFPISRGRLVKRCMSTDPEACRSASRAKALTPSKPRIKSQYRTLFKIDITPYKLRESSIQSLRVFTIRILETYRRVIWYCVP